MPRVYKNKSKGSEDKFPRIKMSSFPLSKPDFRKYTGTKDEIIKTWLKEWLLKGIEKGTIKENSLLPVKADLAYYFGVGAGTVQSAVRKLEDEGFVISKQRVGTLIASANDFKMNKLTSKRDKVVSKIKWYIYNNALKKGDRLPDMRDLEDILLCKRNTIRSAIDYLCFHKYLLPVQEDYENKTWEIIKDIKQEDVINADDEIQTETLAQKVSKKIEEYITKNCKIGDRLDSINSFAKRFDVSDKTAYDAIQILFNQGVIQARRGRYGTIVVKMPEQSAFQPAKENSIFLPAAEAAVYSYKRIENMIRKKIKNEYSIGQKLPSMKKLSEIMDVSTNTIRKAILTLADEGYLSLSRGRFGGIYVIDIPQDNAQSFKWLAVNPQYVKSYR